MTAEDWLKKNYEALGLPQEAIEFLLAVWRAFQFFDDVADGDYSDRHQLDTALWASLVTIPQNQFFCDNRAQISPVISTAILKWQASDQAERNNAASAVSFVWRAGYYDIVLAVYLAAHGSTAATENADLIMRLYGEKFEDYLKEFNHA